MELAIKLGLRNNKKVTVNTDEMDTFKGKSTRKIKSLRKTFTNEELVKKILRSLPKEWLPKVTSLKDSKDSSKVQLDELLGNLIDYEMTLQREHVEELNKAKKNISFKVSSENSSDEEEEFDQEELALVIRRIRKMLFQSKKFIPKRNFKKDKGESSKRDPTICFECDKPGHITADCPKLKKPFKKFNKKAFKAIWDESSDSKDEKIGDQVAQMCFMAMEGSSNAVTLNDDIVEFSYDELINALKVMNDELELSHNKNKLLKKKLVSLRKENETSTKDDKPLGNDMQKSLNELSLENEKKDKLDAILDSQRSPSIKYGLGYSKFTQEPPSNTIFVKASSSNERSPQVPGPKLSNPKGQEPNISTRNETRKTSFHQHAPTQNTGHRRLAHASMDLLANLNKDELVDRLPKIKFQKEKVCDACQMGNFDELRLGDPQSSGNQDQLKEDPLTDLGDNEVVLQE
ncbi:uncharacterized protein LOC131181336 [Hevea brasiliensis]|uniref:uncharacterized protein LOC131181336 n=1 Tax=Hevea brasiliensis TaxID=3981 RepID=UPI0025F16277|nr:uncharacterized protein LOC131181336 [Hevea brasiliensis]